MANRPSVLCRDLVIGRRADGRLPYNPFLAWRAIVEERYLGELKPPLHARIPLPYHLVPGALSTSQAGSTCLLGATRTR